MKEKSPQDEQTSFQEIARQALGDSLQYAMNADSTMVLCQKIRKTNEPPYVSQVRYCVVELESQRIVHQAHMANGEVKWHSPHELQIRNFKGYPTMDETGIYVYDLKKQSRINHQNKGTKEE